MRRGSWPLFLLALLAGCDKGPFASSTPPDPALAAPAPSADDASTADLDPWLETPRGAKPAGSTTPAEGGPTPLEAPLATWMREHAAPAMRQGDAAVVATVLDEIATFAPTGSDYGNWKSIAKDGAAAARAGSLEGVKAACRSCHAQYRNPYKSTLRARPLPSP